MDSQRRSRGQNQTEIWMRSILRACFRSYMPISSYTMIFITGNEERLGIRHISKSNTVHIHLLYPFLFMVHFVFFSSSNPKRFHDVWHSPYKVGPTGWKLVLNRELHSKDARKYNCPKPKCKWSYVHQLSCLKKKKTTFHDPVIPSQPIIAASEHSDGQG